MGRRAAICEQVEDASEAKGIVRREVVETVTPGTVLHDTLLRAERNNFLVAVAPEAQGEVGLAAARPLHRGAPPPGHPGRQVAPELGRLEPAELLLPRQMGGSGTASGRRGWDPPELPGRLALRPEPPARRSSSATTGCSPWTLGFQPTDGSLVRAAGALVQYLREEIQPSGTGHLQPPGSSAPAPRCSWTR
jgi:DNA mismatch repair protein MutS